MMCHNCPLNVRRRDVIPINRKRKNRILSLGMNRNYLEYWNIYLQILLKVIVFETLMQIRKHQNVRRGLWRKLVLKFLYQWNCPSDVERLHLSFVHLEQRPNGLCVPRGRCCFGTRGQQRPIGLCSRWTKL